VCVFRIAFDIETSITRRPGPNWGCCDTRK